MHHTYIHTYNLHNVIQFIMLLLLYFSLYCSRTVLFMCFIHNALTGTVHSAYVHTSTWWGCTCMHVESTLDCTYVISVWHNPWCVHHGCTGERRDLCACTYLCVSGPFCVVNSNGPNYGRNPCHTTYCVCYWQRIALWLLITYCN